MNERVNPREGIGAVLPPEAMEEPEVKEMLRRIKEKIGKDISAHLPQ